MNNNPHKLLRRIVTGGWVTGFTLAASIISVQAATVTWSGAGSDNQWSTAANWGGTTPAAGDMLVFSGTQQHTNNNDLDIAGVGIGPINFTTANWLITGKPIIKQIGNGFTNNGTGPVIWDVPTTLGAANGTVFVTTPKSAGSLIFPNYITGSGSRVFRKVPGANAVGTLSLLCPTNDFGGHVYLGSGPSEFVSVANAGQPSSLGAAASASTVTIWVGAPNTAYGTESRYVGTTDGATDRMINFSGRSSVNFLNNSPNNSSLTFNGAWQFTANTTPTRLTLGGTSAGTNTVNGSMSPTVTSPLFSLDVAGPTTWMFNGANTTLGDVRFVSGTHYLGQSLGIDASITATNVSILPGAVLNVAGMSYGFNVGSSGGQILTAGRMTNSATDIIGTVDLGMLGTLNVGGIGVPATFTLDGALKTHGGVLSMDLGSVPAVDGINDLIQMTGSLDLTGSATLNLLPYAGGLAVNTPYTVIKYSGSLSGSAASLTVPPPSRAYNASVSTDTPGEVRVTFTPSGKNAANLVWTGNAYYWDVNSSTSWLNGTTADVFQQLDTVRFDDTASVFDVNLVNVLAPASIVVDTANTFTFTGGGSLSGGASTAITKKGTGTLKIMTANILSGPITVSAGSLVSAKNTGLGIGDITLGDAATGANDVALLLVDAAATPNKVIVSDKGTGAVTVGRASGGTATFNGGLVLSRSVVITNAGPYAAGSRLYMNGLISGSGDITVNGGGYTTFKPSVTVTNNFTGNVLIRDAGTALQIDAGCGLPETCNVDVGEGAALQPYGTGSINSLNGSGILRAISGTFTLTVGAANGNGLFTGFVQTNMSGGIEGVLNLRKAGTGTQVLTGDSSRTKGGTIVAAGILAVNNTNGSGLGSGTLQVEAAGTLAGNGFIDIGASDATVNGRLLVGNVGDTEAADFAITSTGTLDIAGGTVEVDLFSGAGTGDNTANAAAADVLVAGCPVKLTDAALTVGNPKNLASWAIGDKWKIVNWSTPPTGSFTSLNLPDLGAGKGWDVSQLYSSGVIAVTAAATRPIISIKMEGGKVTLTWQGGGTLQMAGEANGTYSDVAGSSPYVIENPTGRAFYRVRIP